jgi:hypothetical protein
MFRKTGPELPFRLLLFFLLTFPQSRVNMYEQGFDPEFLHVCHRPDISTCFP